jgi:thymidylate kinase
VRRGYLAIAAQEPRRVIKISGSGTIDQIHRQMLLIVKKKLGQ